MKRKYRRKRVVGAVLCTVVCLVLVGQGGIALYHGVIGRMSGMEESVVPESKYPDGKPQAYDEKGIRKKLKKLSEEYPEFEEIRDNAGQYPQKLLSALCSNPEMIDFVKGYPGQSDTGKAVLKGKEKSSGIPFLFQWDKRWGYCSYGDNCIGLSGCAPTCLSMVIVGLTGRETATPDVLAAYAEENGYYVEGTGTAWRIMTEISGYGVVGEEIPADKTLVCRELSQENPVICSMGPGDFTSSGHFIVLAGVEDGKIRVHDPNSSSRSRKLWEFTEFQDQIRNMWVFRRA